MKILEIILRIVQVVIAFLIILAILYWGNDEKQIYKLIEVVSGAFYIIFLCMLLTAVIFGGNELINWICR